MCTLEEICHQTDMVQMYKILHRQYKTTPLFKLAASRERQTRSSADPLNVKFPFTRLEVRKNFFSVRPTALWNNVPAHIKQGKSAEQFKQLYIQEAQKYCTVRGTELETERRTSLEVPMCLCADVSTTPTPRLH